MIGSDFAHFRHQALISATYEQCRILIVTRLRVWINLAFPDTAEGFRRKDCVRTAMGAPRLSAVPRDQLLVTLHFLRTLAQEVGV